MAIPLATMGPTVDDAGISIPTYADVLATLQNSYRSIFGSDVYLEADSQDGEWLAIIAAAINDQNAACVAVYNQFSPRTALGAGLSSVVKINGITRHVPTNSTVDVTLVGQAGTTIADGVVGDTLNQRWTLPSTVVIPPEGQIIVTATAASAGSVSAAPGTVTKILTPSLGWQTVTNAAAATPGAPVETDAQLRQRQVQSTANASVSPLQGLKGALYDLAGVTEVAAYENDTGAVNSDGLPAHSISVVVEGGDAAQIGNAIVSKKTLGAFTYGTTVESVLDPFGIPRLVRFYRPTQVPIYATVSLKALDGYTTAIGAAVQKSVADYINALPIGTDVLIRRLDLPAQLFGMSGAETFELTGLTIHKLAQPAALADIPIAFNEVATSDPANIGLVVT